MAMNFPNAPTVGERFQPPGSPFLYEWDGVAWNVVGGGGSGGGVTIGPTPPASPAPGDQWYNDATGRTMVWFEDVDSGQWVESAPGVVGNPYEPGGMYLVERVDLAGLAVTPAIELLPGYDYEFTVGNISLPSADFLTMDMSSDGGTSWTSNSSWNQNWERSNAASGGSGGSNGNNLGGSYGILTPVIVAGASTRKAHADVKLFEALDASNSTVLISDFIVNGTTVFEFGTFRSWQLAQVAQNAIRLKTGAGVGVTTGYIDIYRRNRSLN